MKLAGDADLGHLTYCTNIHPGESWPEVRAALTTHLPKVRHEVAEDRPFGVGLRLAAVAAEALRHPAARDELKALLAASNCYAFTINGFPYGPFHGRRVKEAVYQPDWRHEERVSYSNLLADLLVELLPGDDALDGSISTVPGTFKPLAEAPGAIPEMARNLIRHAAHLVAIRERSGRTIALALEPEPCCFLETIDETVRFFEQELFGDAAVGQLAELTGLARGAAEDALRRHLGVCYDVCHAAVEFEDAAESLRALRAAGIGVPKLQLSAALRIARVGPETALQLRPFDEPVYLHQVIRQNGGELIRYLDLPDALAALDQNFGAEWRVHFHVPIFLAELKDFSTTQAFLREILALHREEPISAHLEVETYTWDVLPARYRQVDVASAIARELTWVIEQLDA
ncbi:MAG TPA: metabolite traffic protein EboE [Geminicoccaceae bacterium]|nr:metabolite traffic protein EboE [Geminicoccaceae bacterium]